MMNYLSVKKVIVETEPHITTATLVLKGMDMRVEERKTIVVMKTKDWTAVDNEVLLGKTWAEARGMLLTWKNKYGIVGEIPE